MSSFVLDLQNEITTPNCDVVNVLRKAHLIAVKLNLVEFDKWITCELNGYSEEDTVPDYRMIRGILKAFHPNFGWQPTVILDKSTESKVSTVPIHISVSEIISFCSSGRNELISECFGKQVSYLNKLFNQPQTTRYAVQLSSASFGDIVEKVKNTVLEWTIKLESERIIGEGMMFNSEEKENAKQIPQTINNYYGNTNVINAPLEHSVIVAGDKNTLSFTYEKASEMAAEIETALKNENLSVEDQETAMEMLSEIKEKISQQKKPSIIKSALIGLKEFLIGVSASATVALIQAKIQGLF